MFTSHIPARNLETPDLVDTPDEGVLREVMMEIRPREDLATRLSQAKASVSFQGFWEMLPNATTCHHLHEHLCHLSDRYVPVIPRLASKLRNELPELK